MPFSFMRSPSPLEKMESKILKEGKIEDTTVKHELKDLATLEKESQKARKVSTYSRQQLAFHSLMGCSRRWRKLSIP